MRDHAFEDRLHELLRDGRIGLGKPSTDLLDALATELETHPEIVIHKRRAQPARRSMVEVSCGWMGLDADEEVIHRRLDESVARAIPDAIRTATIEPDIVRVRFLWSKNGVFVTGAAICKIN